MTINDVYNRCSCVHVALLAGGFQPRWLDIWTWRIERGQPWTFQMLFRALPRLMSLRQSGRVRTGIRSHGGFDGR